MIPLIQFRGATLGYPGVHVLTELDLSVDVGDFLLIGGPNGGGKTTLLKSIAGLMPPLAGVRQCGAWVGGVRFGYVPQQGQVNQALVVTGREMVDLAAACTGPWWRDAFGGARKVVTKALEDCQAAEFCDVPFGVLSGGQKQRILLARALAVAPSCLLLDEPTAGVDYPTQLAVAELLKGLNRERKITVLLVTHEPVPFLKAASRAVWVNGGRCVEVSTQEFGLNREG